MAKKKVVRQVCVCENCGNEAEMELTCTMVEEEIDVRLKIAVVEDQTLVNHPW